jgi:acyl dehydratase
VPADSDEDQCASYRVRAKTGCPLRPNEVITAVLLLVLGRCHSRRSTRRRATVTARIGTKARLGLRQGDPASAAPRRGHPRHPLPGPRLHPGAWQCEPHHICHREHGGLTKLANLSNLCWFHHHTLIHQKGWAAELNGDGTLTFRRPDGTTYPNGPLPDGRPSTVRPAGSRASAARPGSRMPTAAWMSRYGRHRDTLETMTPWAAPQPYVTRALGETDFTAPADDRYFEDYLAGAVYEYGYARVTEEEIIAFARRFDPQSFHVDPQLAAAGPFGGLVASGWHTTGIFMRLFADHYLSQVASLGSPGVDELRWANPVRPGDVLRLRTTITGTRRSNSRPDRGIVHTQAELLNQDDRGVLSLMVVNLLGLREH